MTKDNDPEESEPSPQSKGGKSRAEKLSPEKLSEIARHAANARWANSGMLRATHDGDLKLETTSVKAAVLPNGKRLITQGTLLVAIGRSRTPKAGTGGLATVDGLPFFLQAEQLKPFISEELRLSTTPIFFRLKDGQRAVGYDANLLPMICEVYLKLRDACLAATGNVPKKYAHIIQACDVLMRGLARVGIIALVDEATGYQKERAQRALAEILEQFIAKELQPWTRTFPLDFYEEIFRLRGWKFDPASVKRPAVIGHYTNDIVYKRLAPGVLKELRDKNPVVDGRRKHKHFQWLTGTIGHPKLEGHIEAVKALMRASDSWDQFKKMLSRSYPIIETTDLGFEIEVRDKSTDA